MLGAFLVLVVTVAAPAPPAWVAQQQCVAEPAADLACDADPIRNATPNDLAQCACDLLVAGGLGGCDELRDSGGRTLAIDRKLSGANPKSVHRQPQLIAALGALAAMRVVSMTNQDFTVDAFNDHSLPRPVEETLRELPVAEMLFETAKTAFLLPTLETLVTLRAKQALTSVPAATGSCRRLLAAITKPQDAAPEATRDDLICSLARTEPSPPPLAPRWPWCGGCSGEGSRALPFAMPATNVRYPAMFEQRARSLDNARANTATQWACITTRERTPDLQFGNAPISLAITSSLARFATLASLAASPYSVEDITLGDCAALRLDPLRQGARLTLAQLTAHARGNACDIERVRYATADGKHIDIDFRADKLIPAFRDFTLDRGIRELYNDFAEQVRGEEPAADMKRDEVILAVLTRKALQDAGFVIFDPLLGLGHRGALHVEANPATPVASALGKGFDASQMTDWLVDKALDPNHQRNAPGTATDTDHIAELNRVIREGASKRDIIDAERAKVTIRGASRDPIANLLTRDNRQWCANDNAVSVTLDFVEPAPAYELDVWGGDTGITVTADGKPWTQSGAHHFAAPERTPVRSLTIHAKAAKGRACLRFVVQGRHTGEAGKLRDLTIQRVTRTDDIPALRPFIADLAQAIDECDGTTLADLAQLPLTIDVDQSPIKRTYRNARELARGCRQAELPRPSPELALTTDGLTASQHFEQWMIGAATWRYKAEHGRWRLVGATAP